MIGLRNHYTMDFHIFQGFLPRMRNLFEKFWSKAHPSPFFDIFLNIPTFLGRAVRRAARDARRAFGQQICTLPAGYSTRVTSGMVIRHSSVLSITQLAESSASLW